MDRFVLVLLFGFVGTSVWAQSVASIHGPDTLESASREMNGKHTVWFMAGFFLDLVNPNVGSGANVMGSSYLFGIARQNVGIFFTKHSTSGVPDSTAIEEHRHDYALLLGLSHRQENSVFNLGVGVGAVNYYLRGSLITPPSTRYANDAVFQWRSGTSFGLAGIVGLYFTPIQYWGLAGIGLYGSLTKGVSYFALEFSLIELNIPFPVP